MSAIIPKPSAPVASQYLYPKSLPFHGTRNPVTHSGRGFRAKFGSRKNRRMVRCESLLEMHFLYLAEFARNVVSFDEQPVSIAYRLNGRQRRYTPDFGLRWRDGRQWYVEVKPHELLALDKNQEKFEAIGEHFRREGDTFITISEREIRPSHPHAACPRSAAPARRHASRGPRRTWSTSTSGPFQRGVNSRRSWMRRSQPLALPIG
jgi:hypothetical protein